MHIPPKGPGRTRCVVLPGDWPRIDQDLWHLATLEGDALDPGGIAAAWAPATRTLAINAYGRWLHWLLRTAPAAISEAPAARVTEIRVAAYITDERARSASASVSTHIAFLLAAMTARVPDADWSWLRRIAARLRREARPARDKRPSIRPTRELLDLGMALMTDAESIGAVTTWEQATLYRDGLMIALLAVSPLRRSNSCGIEIGRHLVRRGADYWVTFPREEMKNRRAFQLPIAPELTPRLDLYLALCRPWLCRQTANRNPHQPFIPAGNRLWVSKTGSAMSEAVFFKGLRKRTTTRFGRTINPHLFRDCAATTIAEEMPELVHITAGLLGHASLKTSERFYNHANALEASRRWHAVMLDKPGRTRQRRSNREG